MAVRVIRVQFVENAARSSRKPCLARFSGIARFPRAPRAVILGELRVGELPVADGPGVLDQYVLDHFADHHPRVERSRGAARHGTGADGTAQRRLVERVQAVSFPRCLERIMAPYAEVAVVTGIGDWNAFPHAVLFHGVHPQARGVQVAPYEGGDLAHPHRGSNWASRL